jgi:hypothetical protein
MSKMSKLANLYKFQSSGFDPAATEAKRAAIREERVAWGAKVREDYASAADRRRERRDAERAENRRLMEEAKARAEQEEESRNAMLRMQRERADKRQEQYEALGGNDRDIRERRDIEIANKHVKEQEKRENEEAEKKARERRRLERACRDSLEEQKRYRENERLQQRAEDERIKAQVSQDDAAYKIDLERKANEKRRLAEENARFLERQIAEKRAQEVALGRGMSNIELSMNQKKVQLAKSYEDPAGANLVFRNKQFEYHQRSARPF